MQATLVEEHEHKITAADIPMYTLRVMQILRSAGESTSAFTYLIDKSEDHINEEETHLKYCIMAEWGCYVDPHDQSYCKSALTSSTSNATAVDDDYLEEKIIDRP